MDKEILKLFPKKAFKLISLKDSIRIGSLVTKSLLDSLAREDLMIERQKAWRLLDVVITPTDKTRSAIDLTAQEGEKILKVYFSQFYQEDLAVHLDFRTNSFYSDQKLHWIPSKLHFKFSPNFLKGVQTLYRGFYYENREDFSKGLELLGMIKASMNSEKKDKIMALFMDHFGEGRSSPVNFSLQNLQKSFNSIFTFFLQEDIELNPEFAVLGINLVTLYLTLEQIPFAINVKRAFFEVDKLYATK